MSERSNFAVQRTAGVCGGRRAVVCLVAVPLQPPAADRDR